MKQFIDKLKRGVKKVAKAVVDAIKALCTIVPKSTAEFVVAGVGLVICLAFGEDAIRNRALERIERSSE